MSHLPTLPNATLIDVFATAPETFECLHVFAEAVMRGSDSPFSAGERERMAAFVSRLNGCVFCEASHGAAAARFGADPAAVTALVEDPSTAPVPEAMKPVYSYLRTLTLEPGAVSAAEVRAILDAGWPEAAVTGANLVCGVFAMMNRLVEGLGIGSDPATVEMAGRHLHDRGYVGISDLVKSRAG